MDTTRHAILAIIEPGSWHSVASVRNRLLGRPDTHEQIMALIAEGVLQVYQAGYAKLHRPLINNNNEGS